MLQLIVSLLTSMSHTQADPNKSTTAIKSERVWSPYELTQLSRHKVSTGLIIDTESPVEYLTGHVDFAGLDFLVSKETLIPRVETEELVGLAWNILEEQISVGITPCVLDVGTGCGAIAISLAYRAAQAGKTVQILATDISSTALKVAEKNTHRLTPKANIQFLQSDLLAAVPKQQQFTLITANLPYIPTERIAYLESSVKDFEPQVALDGGSDGLYLIKLLLSSAADLLQQNSKVVLEVDYTHTVENFLEFRPNWTITSSFDTYNRNRFIIATKK